MINTQISSLSTKEIMSHHQNRQQGACAPATLRTEIILVFGFLLSIFFLTSAGYDTSEGSYDYAVARQIWTEGALSFSQPREGVYTVAPNGRTYASHEIGNTLFLLPVAGVNVVIENALANRYDGHRIGFVTSFLVNLMPAIYCSITIALFYAMLRLYFRKTMTCALASSMAFAFCTLLWSYSRILSDVVLCMCLLTTAMFFIMQFRRTEKTRTFLIAIAVCGLGIITRLTMVLLLVALAAYLTMVFWRDWKRLIRLMLIGVAAIAPFALWQAYYDQLRTGHWLLSPVISGQYASTNALTGNLVFAALGLLFSPGKSIFLYIPLALLSVISFRRFMTSYPCEALFVAVLSAMWLIIHSKMATNWYGAWGWGPRHFVTIAPVLVLPACVSWEWMKENPWRHILLRCALTWGAILTVSSIIGNWHFRMALADSQGKHDYDVMLWSPTQGQAVDMIAGAASNIRNMMTGKPGPCLSSYSTINCYASNTVNVWMNSAAYAGVPRLLLASAALGLLSVAAYCWLTLCQMRRQCAEAVVA
jgi:hypothetical protein